MTKEITDMTAEEVSEKIEELLRNGNGAKGALEAMQFVEYAKDQGYFEFPNGESLSKYESDVFEKWSKSKN
jgi:hypothetical protein